MSTAAQHATDAVLLTTAILKAQTRDDGCEQPCDCGVCFPTREALDLLKIAHKEATK